MTIMRAVYSYPYLFSGGGGGDYLNKTSCHQKYEAGKSTGSCCRVVFFIRARLHFSLDSTPDGCRWCGHAPSSPFPSAFLGSLTFFFFGPQMKVYRSYAFRDVSFLFVWQPFRRTPDIIVCGNVVGRCFDAHSYIGKWRRRPPAGLVSKQDHHHLQLDVKNFRSFVRRTYCLHHLLPFFWAYGENMGKLYWVWLNAVSGAFGLGFLVPCLGNSEFWRMKFFS